MTRNQNADGARRNLAGLIARLADNKNLLGRQYAEWCSSAPTLESAVAAAAMAQDELGHARALYPLLRTLAPDAGQENDPETRTHLMALAFLQQPFAAWEDFVTANFLVDRALTLVFEAAQSSTYEPLAGRSRKVLQEERTHTLHGNAWVRRLAHEGGAVREALLASLLRAWDEVLCWFGPEGADDPLAAQGVLDATPDTLRSRFLAAVGPLVVSAGLDLPVHEEREGVWVLTRALPWDRWNGYLIAPENAAAQVSATGTGA